MPKTNATKGYNGKNGYNWIHSVHLYWSMRLDAMCIWYDWQSDDVLKFINFEMWHAGKSCTESFLGLIVRNVNKEDSTSLGYDVVKM